MQKFKLSILIDVVFIILLSFLAIKPLFTPGFFPMHDNTQVARIFEMHKSLASGMFPVRWVSDLGYGYGYPIFNFYGPLAYYIGALVMFIGANALLATKITIGLGVILSGLFMYLLGKDLWGRLGGILSSVFYMYATYHAVDIYVRGDVAEFWAYAFIPLTFYAIWKIYQKRSWKYVSIGILGYAGIILSHNLSALLISPFIILAIVIASGLLIKRKEYKSVVLLFSIMAFGIIISAFYWLPALSEIKFTNVLSQIGGSADYHLHFVCPYQLWYSPWGYGGSAKGCIDGLSFMIGKLHIIFSFIGIILGLLVIRKNKTIGYLLLLLCLGFIISILLTTNYSVKIWDVIPAMAFLQYPWRFLVAASFFSSLITGGVFYVVALFIKNRFSRIKFSTVILFTIILFCVLFLQAKFFVPKNAMHVSVGYYTNQNALLWTASKISDEYMPKEFLKPTSSNSVNKLTMSPVSQSIIVVSKIATAIRIPIAYFPAWHIFVDNKEISYTIVKNGLTIVVPAGKHTIRTEFIQTPIEVIADIISLCGLICLFLGILYPKKIS